MEGPSRLKGFCIPSYILDPEAQEKVERSPEEEVEDPSCPVVVFVNTRSGGRLGADLLKTYGELLNEAQVFDLGERAPEKVLHMLFGNLERLRQSGDQLADHILNHLRLIVAGGDGTAGWLLGVVCDLKLTRPPPIATVPLGTGNNLPFAFGWGKRNPGTDCESVKSFLDQVKGATPMKIDNWHITMKMKAPQAGSFEPIAPLELPHSLHKFRRLSSTDSSNEEGCHTFRGGFWNYFSMGMDAHVSYAFHSERKAHPDKFKNQSANQRTYAKLGVKQGWFLPALVQDESSDLSKLVKIEVIDRLNPQGWRELPLHESIRSIICLNLPSFSGGLNPWGTPNTRRHKYRNFTSPYVDDGFIEVVGFKDAWQGLLLLAPKGHGTRLAQVHRIKFEFREGLAKETYMRLDGEPWKQPLPREETVVIDISYHGQVTMLATPDCKSKSSVNPSTHSASSYGDDSDENSEERRKFGAADTFKIPEDISVSHFS